MYKFRSTIKPSEITSSKMYLNRRQVLASLLTLPMASTILPQAMADNVAASNPLPFTQNPDYRLEKRGYGQITPKEKALTYNNFYELGPEKHEPAENAHLYSPSPWKVKVWGEVRNPGEFDIDDLLALAPLEERVYRLRCVEAWSMVVPWIGYSFSHLARAVEPTEDAKYVKFATFDPHNLFPEHVNRSLSWPYVEGLRLDEAMNPLAMLTFGLYGERLTTQNGAPVRIVSPWKYGFKSGKALVEIYFSKNQPRTAWNKAQSSEYGFYANVNPTVNHPRWSQASERAITDSFLPKRRRTEIFNGYADEVAHLYKDMDLSKFF